MASLDSVHFTFFRIDGAQKTFNFIVSAREDGKSTASHIAKARKAFREGGKPSIILRRNVNDISESYVESVREILWKFRLPGESPSLIYKKSDLDSGIVRVIDGETKKLRYMMVGISKKLGSIKSNVILNPAYMFFDEFIVNTRAGERYLPDEAFKFQEIYDTFYREADVPPKVYFMGNPYSFFNPYFAYYGINPRKGKFQTGKNWAFEFHELEPELKEYLKAHNPQFVDDDLYTRYAFSGEAINDLNIKIREKLPQNYALFCYALVLGKTLAIYENNDPWDEDNQFWVGICGTKIGMRRDVMAFDFSDLRPGSRLFSLEDKITFERFKRAIQLRQVAYDTLESDYLIEGVYSNL